MLSSMLIFFKILIPSLCLRIIINLMLRELQPRSGRVGCKCHNFKISMSTSRKKQIINFGKMTLFSPALLSVRGLMLSNRGRLELMLEILRLAAAKKRSLVGSNEMTDVVVAMDVMWALRDYSLFNEVSHHKIM